MLDGVLGEIFFELWNKREKEENVLAYKRHLRRVILDETRGRVDIEMSKKLDEHIAAWWFQDQQDYHRSPAKRFGNRRQSSTSRAFDVSNISPLPCLVFRFLACSFQPIRSR